MSGVSGSNRISREDYIKVLEDYKENILSKLPGFVSVVTSGSFNSDQSKMDFGDMDIIVHFDTELSKKDLKKNIADYFKSLPDDIAVPFTSEKHAGKKYYNSGEIVTINYPQPNGTVQIDNIIALSDQEKVFKKEFLDMPAEKQGLVLGLVKVSVQEHGVMKFFKDFNFLPAVRKDHVIEFNLSSVELQMRSVLYDENLKQIEKYVIWTSDNWQDVLTVLSDYDLTKSFKELLSDCKLKLSDRAKRRVIGVFKSMVSVKSGEVGTPKGETKLRAIEMVESLGE